MTFKAHDARKLALLGAAAIATLGGLAAPAQAASTTLNYSCEYPYIAAQPVTATIDLDFPSTVPSGVLTAPADISAVTVADPTVSLLWDVVGTPTVDSVTTVETNLSAPGLTLPVSIPLSAVGTDAFVSPFTIDAAGLTPRLTFRKPGKAQISVTGLNFTMSAKYADGTTADLDGDGSPDFAVSCTQLPGQDTKLDSFRVTKG